VKVFTSSSLIVLFAVSAHSAFSQLGAGDAFIVARHDGSGMVTVATDDPFIRFEEIDGAVVAVRVTPLDRSGAVVGGGA